MIAALWGPEGRVIQDDCSIVGPEGRVIQDDCSIVGAIGKGNTG